MSDRLYLSCWVRGFNESNMLRYYGQLLDRHGNGSPMTPIGDCIPIAEPPPAPEPPKKEVAEAVPQPPKPEEKKVEEKPKPAEDLIALKPKEPEPPKVEKPPEPPKAIVTQPLGIIVGRTNRLSLRGQLVLPAGVAVDYEDVKYFAKYVAPGYRCDYLILVTSQFGDNKVSVFGYLKRN